jgi:hypothetical protein
MQNIAELFVIMIKVLYGKTILEKTTVSKDKSNIYWSRPVIALLQRRQAF